MYNLYNIYILFLFYTFIINCVNIICTKSQKIAKNIKYGKIINIFDNMLQDMLIVLQHH